MLTSTLFLLAAALAGPPTGEPWKLHAIDNTSVGADGVRLADFDGDGLPDIATGWEEGGVIRVYSNPGAEAARVPWPMVEVAKVKAPEDAVFADLDGDGRLDVVSCSEGEERKVWIHWAPGDPERYMDGAAWETVTLPVAAGKSQWMFCLPMQVDGANGIDLVAGSKNFDAAIGWFEAPPDPRDVNAWQWHSMRDAGWVMSLIPFDVDGDGLTDVAYTDRRQVLRSAGWLKNPGPADPAALRGPWKDHTFGGREMEVMFMNHGAFTPAGPTEWVCATRGRGLLRFMGDAVEGSWRQEEIRMPEETGTGKGVAIGDLSGDRRADIAVSCEAAQGRHGVFWLEQTDTGWVPHAVSGLLGTKFDLIELYDFDQDGDLDLLTCEEAEKLGVIWYENPLR
jgi:hypothetical protein